MISQSIAPRKDGKSSAADVLAYGEGLGVDKETGELLDKSHRTRLGGFFLAGNGIYQDFGAAEMAALLEIASKEMQANCDMNKKVAEIKKIEHIIFSFGVDRPSEAAIRDTEDSALKALRLDKNHFASFLHSDNGYWHLHIFSSRIDKEKHNGNNLFQDQLKRDRVCREVEIRHNLERDEGAHRIDEHSIIVEIPKDERRKIRKQKAEAAPEKNISDRAKSVAKYSGEVSFQEWCQKIRIGDRLKPAQDWQDLHAVAASYGCEIKQRGAGLVLCALDGKGSITLSKIGLKNLPAKFQSEFEPVNQNQNQSVHRASEAFQPGPSISNSTSNALYAEYKRLKTDHKKDKFIDVQTLRKIALEEKKQLQEAQKLQLAQLRKSPKGDTRFEQISITKMRHVVETSQLISKHKIERENMREKSPGNTFSDFLIARAQAGNDEALALVQQFANKKKTKVLEDKEESRQAVIAKISGQQNYNVPRLPLGHHVAWISGNVIYDLGGGRKLVDAANSKQIQLNDLAACDPASIETSLRFAASKFGNTLTLTGPAAFQQLAVQTAVQRGLFVNFADPSLEQYRNDLILQKKAALNSNRIDFSSIPKTQLAKGVTNVLRRSFDQGIPDPYLIARFEHDQVASDAARRSGLHELPSSPLDAERRKDAGMLLPGAVPPDLGDKQAGQYSDMRRTSTSGSRSSGEGAGRTTTSATAADPDRAGRGEVYPGRRSRRSNPAITNPRIVARHPSEPEESQRGGLHVDPQPVEAKPTPLMSCADWIKNQPKRQREPATSKTADLFVAHLADDGVVVSYGREVAIHPLPPGVELRVGQKIVIGKDGTISLPQERDHDGGKGRA